MRIVLDDQQQRIAGFKAIAVVGDLFGLMLLEAGPKAVESEAAAGSAVFAAGRGRMPGRRN